MFVVLPRFSSSPAACMLLTTIRGPNGDQLYAVVEAIVWKGEKSIPYFGRVCDPVTQADRNRKKIMNSLLKAVFQSIARQSLII